MPAYTMEQLPGLPVIVLRFLSDFNLETDIADVIPHSDRMIEGIPGKVYFVCDATEMPMPTIMAIIESTNSIIKKSNLEQNRQRLEEIVLISPNRVIQLAAAGLNSRAFAWLNVKVFATYDAGLD